MAADKPCPQLQPSLLYTSQPLSLTAPCLAPNVCFVIASAAAGPTGATVNCVPPDISQVNAKLLCIRRLVGSTNQAESSGFYFKIA